MCARTEMLFVLNNTLVVNREKIVECCFTTAHTLLLALLILVLKLEGLFSVTACNTCKSV